MKKTLQDQYLLIKEGKGHKDVFIKEAKRQFPGLIRNSATYTEVANVLKTKNLINENVIGLEPINQLEPSKKESYEVAFENFLAEAKKKKEEDEKAELKKPSKQVEEDAEKNFDYKDKKNPDNLIFDQIMKGYYTEMKDPKNEDKTMEQLKAIVVKNLEKNPIYYTEKGQFGVKDLGYTSDVPGLGEPKEPKGKYKSSGYGNLNEDVFKSRKLDLSNLSSKSGKTSSIDDEKEENAIIKALKDLGDDMPGISQPVMALINKIKGISKRKNENKDPLNEEDQIRKVVRSMINEELEDEFYQKQQDLDNMNFDQEKEAHKQAKEYSTEGITQHVNYDGTGYFVSDEFSKETIATYKNGEMISEELEEAVDSEEDERYFIKSKKRRTTSQLPGFHKPALGEEELEEGYWDGLEMGTHQSKDTEHMKNPQDIETYLKDIQGIDRNSGKNIRPTMTKIESIKYLGNKIGLSSSMVEKIIDRAEEEGIYDVQDMYDINPTIRGDVFLENKDDDGFDEVWDRFKKDLRKRMGQPEPPKNESLNESKIRKVIRESVEKELAEINKLAEYEVYESKLEKIAELIEKKCSRLNRLDEDEDLKALTDKKKVKELQKDIKKLEKAKAKLEKALSKKTKSSPKKKEVIDEDEELDEAELNEIDPKGMEAANDAAGEMAKNFKDIESTVSKIELEEEDEDDSLEENNNSGYRYV